MSIFEDSIKVYKNMAIARTQDCINYQKEIERLQEKIDKYENPDDMTLMFMWCDEKVKDENKRLHSIIKEVREYIEEMQIWINYLDDFGVTTKGLLEILNKVDKE